MRDWCRRILKRLRLAFRILVGASPGSRIEELGAVSELLSGIRSPGFPCPRCDARIIVDIRTLLARSKVVCGKCGLDLDVDWEEDERARRTLERLELAARELERTRAFRR